MNPYLENLDRIEFPITYSCTGRCRHCSEADKSKKRLVSGEICAEAVKRIASAYNIRSVMTFGGEPLLYPEDVFKIHSAAREAGIPKRQIITNGCFTKDRKKSLEIAARLVESSCNAVLISADIFHQEFLPIDDVIEFACEINRISPSSVKVNPAWIKGRGAGNEYDRRTAEIVSEFERRGVPCGKGNVIFPAGNALKYLSEYFEPGREYINPYEEDPKDLKTVSIEPDGSVLGGNILSQDILTILDNYRG